MRRSADARRVSDALKLRRAVLALLSARPAGEEDCRIACEASPDAWEIVLACECCVLPLAARLRAGALQGTLSREVHGRIAAAELVETQRVLAARAILDELDEVGAELGIDIVILKGGAHAGEPGTQPLDLADVDAMIDDHAADALWNRLAARGWRLQTGARMPAAAQRLDSNHFVPIIPAADSLFLELHTRAEYGSQSFASIAGRSRLLRGRRSLHRLVGDAAFVMMLEHCVVKHPPRRGHVRDIILLANALAESGESHRAIEVTLAAGPMAPELLSMYAQVCAFARGERVTDDVATTAFVTWKYAQFLRPRGVVGPFLPGWKALSYLPLERDAVHRSALAWQLRYALAPVPASSPFASLAGKTREDRGRLRLLRGARSAAARAARAVYRLGLLATLVLTSGYIRRRIRDLSRP